MSVASARGRERLAKIAEEIGIEVLYRPAESFDGALLRIRDAQRGYIVINSRIREESRRRFTLAHEIGHFVLPGQQEVSAPCKQQRIENWDADLYRPELEANRFAAEILMPRRLTADGVLAPDPQVAAWGLAREPLVHFLVIGALLFLLNAR